jgi:hypothetical protein
MERCDTPMGIVKLVRPHGLLLESKPVSYTWFPFSLKPQENKSRCIRSWSMHTSSSVGESHPRACTDPDVSLSAHTAPIDQVTWPCLTQWLLPLLVDHHKADRHNPFAPSPLYQVALIEVRISMTCRGAPACAPSTQGGHIGPPLQKLNYLFDRIMVLRDFSATTGCSVLLPLEPGQQVPLRNAEIFSPFGPVG